MQSCCVYVKASRHPQIFHCHQFIDASLFYLSTTFITICVSFGMSMISFETCLKRYEDFYTILLNFNNLTMTLLLKMSGSYI